MAQLTPLQDQKDDLAFTTVIYDHQAFVMQRWGGISRYFAELAKNVAACPGMRPLVMAPWANNEYLTRMLGIKSRSISAHYRHRGVGELMALESKFDRRALGRLFARYQNAVYHPTYYDPFLLKDGLENPVVITIHDMIYELFSGKLSGSGVVRQKREMIERADHIVTVSQSTFDDLVRFYPKAAQKSSVIYHGVSFAPYSSRGRAFVEGDYLLFVGSRSAYKNFAGLAQAFAESAVNHLTLKLVCVGGGRFSKKEQSLLEERGIAQRVIHKEASDEQLKNLYHFAKAFVFPSLYEGFGLPILEAMSCGAPCVLSDIPVFHEVAADAACYCDARSSYDMAQTIDDVLEDAERRGRLRAAGYERVGEFSWARCAREHAALYRRLDKAYAAR